MAALWHRLLEAAAVRGVAVVDTGLMARLALVGVARAADARLLEGFLGVAALLGVDLLVLADPAVA